MDVRIEAAPMAATIEMVTPTVKVFVVASVKALSQAGRVASFSCPSIAGHSISAVAPDYILTNGGLALGIAA